MGQINITIILIRGRITDKEVQEEENRDLAVDKDTKGFGSHQQPRRRVDGQPLLHTLTSELQTVI